MLPAVSWAIYKKRRLFVFFQSEQYLDYFPNIRKNRYVKFLFAEDKNNQSWLERRTMWLSNDSRKNIGARFKRTMLCSSNKEKNVVTGELAQWDEKRGFRFVDGWAHRYDVSFIKEERESVLEMFKPRQDFIENVEKEFRNYEGITVGVHVRRGDYKEYYGGKWCFDDDTYLDAIRDIKDLLTNKETNVRFLICSNEPFTLRSDIAEMFQIAPLFPSDCMTDLYALSRCDYIIGPPSTFSQWASYYGHVPLRFLRWKGDEIFMSEFIPFVLLDRSEKGYDPYLYEVFHTDNQPQ